MENADKAHASVWPAYLLAVAFLTMQKVVFAFPGLVAGAGWYVLRAPDGRTRSERLGHWVWQAAGFGLPVLLTMGYFYSRGALRGFVQANFLNYVSAARSPIPRPPSAALSAPLSRTVRQRRPAVHLRAPFTGIVHRRWRFRHCASHVVADRGIVHHTRAPLSVLPAVPAANRTLCRRLFTRFGISPDDPPRSSDGFRALDPARVRWHSARSRCRGTFKPRRRITSAPSP